MATSVKDFGAVFRDPFATIVGYTNNAGYHNSLVRGKDITSYFTDGSLSNRIAGTNGYSLFEDLFLGDYITITYGGVSRTFIIVDFDYYIRCGSVDVTQHHIVMMPIGAMNIPSGTVLYGGSATLSFLSDTATGNESATAFKWNATTAAPGTHTTAGGYKYSRMRTIIMRAADTIVVNSFGSGHILPITPIYYNPADASASGLASGWAWYSETSWDNPLHKSICDLPNETQVYGQQIWGLGSAHGNVGYEIGIDKFQFALFARDRSKVNFRAAWWLRSVS